MELLIPLEKDEVCDILQALECNHTLEKLKLVEYDYFRSTERIDGTASEQLPAAADSSWAKGSTKLANFLRLNSSLKNLKLYFKIYVEELYDIVHSLKENHTLEKLALPRQLKSQYSSMSIKESRISWITGTDL